MLEYLSPKFINDYLLPLLLYVMYTFFPLKYLKISFTPKYFTMHLLRV